MTSREYFEGLNIDYKSSHDTEILNETLTQQGTESSTESASETQEKRTPGS